MLTLALALAGGILLAHSLWRPPIWIGIATTVFVVSAAILCSRRPRLAWLIAHLAVIALGWIAYTGQTERQSADTPDISQFTDGKQVTVVGSIIRAPDLLTRSSDYLQVDITSKSIDDGFQKRDLAAGLRLNLYSNHKGMDTFNVPTQQLNYGDCIRVTAKLRPPKNFRNPGALDYEAYLRRQGIVALGSGKAASLEIIGSKADRIGRWQASARHAVIARIHQLWPERQAGLMDAMLIGERAFIDRELSTDFQRSGTYHILVVSGMNVGILAVVVFWLLRRMHANEFLASLLTVALSSAYAFLCDGGAPIVRATLMLSIFMIARLLYRDRSPLTAVGTAAAFVLLADPAGLFDTSFILTFLCVLVIAGLGIPILERTSAQWRGGLRHFQSTMYDLALPPKVVQLRIDLRMFIERISRFAPESVARFLLLRFFRWMLAAWEILLISALMQIALVLPMAVYFHRATLTALPANMLVVPLTEILMPASVAALALSYASSSLAVIPALVAGWALDAITGTVRIAGSLRVADLRLPTPSLITAALSVLSLCTTLVAVRRSRRLAIASLAFLIGSAIFLVTRPASPQLTSGKLEVSAIDVGQADSTLLVSPQGRTMLVDAAGPLGFSRSGFDFGENVVSPYLWARGFSRLDVVVITHGHSDHIGGMKSVVNNFRPLEMWTGPLPDTPEIESLIGRARELGITIRQFQAGDQFDWGGTHVRILSPTSAEQAPDAVRNNDSLAMEIGYRETAVLLEGDSEKEAEYLIAARHPRATLLKVAHNGSATSTTPELLDAAQPRYAFISVGARNPFRHPRPEVLGRLAERHITTYRTDTMGALTFLLDGNSVETTVGK